MAILKRFIKIFLIFLGILLILVLSLVFAIQIPSVQNFVKDKAVSYLSEKIDTKVELDYVNITFPNKIKLENLYVQGKDVDTLLYMDYLEVGLEMKSLLNNKAEITSIDLDNLKANINKDKNGDFNFKYILDAFATNEDEEKESKPFIISLDKIDLKRLNVTYNDEQSKLNFNVFLNELNTNVKQFNLQENNYAIGDVNLDGLKFYMGQGIVDELKEKVAPKVDSIIDAKPMNISLGNLNLTNINVGYNDNKSKTNVIAQFNKLILQPEKIDLEKQNFIIKNITLDNANLLADLFLEKETDKTPTNVKDITPEKNKLSIVVNELNFNNVNAHYKNSNGDLAVKKSLNFNNIKLTELNTSVEQILYTNDEIKANVKNLEVNEHSGLKIEQLKGDIKYGETETFVKDLLLKTPNTLLKDNVLITYKNRSDLSNDLNNVNVKINLDKSYLGISDLLKLAPQLSSTTPFNLYPNAKLNINTTVRGTLKKMFIDDLVFSGIDKTSIKASAVITNATDPKKLGFDLNIKEFKTNASTLLKIVPKGVIPPSISLPENISLAGTLTGTLNNIKAKINLQTSLGNAVVNVLFDQRIKGKENYDIKASLKNFNAGQIIKNKSLGTISADVDIKGSSLSPETINADLKANVLSAQFNGYTYQDLSLKGIVKNGNYDLKLQSFDPNAALNLVANGNFTKNTATTEISGEVENVNLKELKFTKEEMAFSGKIEASFSNLNPDMLNGTLFLDDFKYKTDKEIFPIQSVKLYAVSTEEENVLQLNTQLIDLRLEGKYKLTQISESLLQTLNTYYKFTNPKDISTLKIDPGQRFTVIGAVKDDELIKKFLPELKEFETINISGGYDADLRKVDLNFTSPKMIYGKNEINDVLLNIGNNEQALVMNANVGGFNSESFSLNEINLGASVENNQINFDLSVLDLKEELQYSIGGNFDSSSDEKRFVLNNEGIILNYENWMVNPENYFAISSKGLYAHNIILENEKSKISVFSDDDSPNSPLNIEIENFEIETITKILQTDTSLASGLINGSVKINDLQKQISFSADMGIVELQLFGNKLGDVAVIANNETENLVNAKATLKGFNNDVLIDGNYNIKNNIFDFDIDIKALQIESLQGFSMNQISNSRGFLSGKLKAEGTADDPSILGKLKFNNIGFNVVQLNTVFQNMNDEISFTKDAIVFNKFKISDVENNLMNIDGTIRTKKYRDFDFGLTIKADDFKVVNAKESGNAIVYGVVAIDADLRVGGNLNLPKIDGKLTVTENTDFSFVMPQSSPALEEREGIIEFIDKNKIATNQNKEEEALEINTVKGIDANVNISVLKEAKITVVMDKVNGDFVKIQGEAELTGGIDPSGKMTLLGNYEVKEGVYEMSVNVLRRKFIIEEGSTITWTGEPTQADINITAIYKTKAAPLDLLQQQLVGLSSNELNTYKQQISFNTFLKINGEMLKPEISFDITVDDVNNSVSSDIISNVNGKLDQLRTSESELNKQVFALLLLNRFIGENPFESSSGFNAESIARQSVSKLLTSQLNNLASELIQGVELDFNLDSTEDFSSGEKVNRTDLNIGISKTLLDDRLKVSIGSNFGLEGQERQNENMTTIAGDINVEYKLSKDGRYILRAYRKDEYQVALQGQIIETGVGFIITLEYDKFKELFTKAKNTNDQRPRYRDVKQPITREDEK